MAKRTVKWTRTADIQYVGILEYWVKRNKSVNYSKMLIKIVAERTSQIVSDFKNELKNKNISNPDIGLGSQNNIYLSDSNHVEIIVTNLNVTD